MPVHWSGLICDMKKIREISENNSIPVVEDACHAINANREGYTAGIHSESACFSMHPLKNLNVWGDGGIVVTNDKTLHDKLVLLRNHGLKNRDICEVFAYNSRLDSIQAIVGKHYIKKIDHITDKRIENATFFDSHLSDIPEISIPVRNPKAKQVFHLYCLKVKNRDSLQRYLVDKGIDAKVHYPIPMHLQPASKKFGYKKGDFPITERICEEVISLPVHEFILKDQREFIVEMIKEFYS